MAIDRRRKNKAAAIARTGLKYVARDRYPAEPETAPSAVSSPAPKTSALTAAPAETSVPRATAQKTRSTPPPSPFQAAPQLDLSGDATAAFASPELPFDEKILALEALAAEVAACTKCDILCRSRSQTVFSDGPPAELCFVGEAPGADEDLAGKPFVGAAGQLMNKIIEACRLKREEIYICNVLKCRPPNNRVPDATEIANCKPYLQRQIELVRPKMIVAWGRFAAAHLLGVDPEKIAITKIRGQVKLYHGVPCMLTLHPAYLLRNPAAKRDVWDDMREVLRRIGRPLD